MDPVLAPPAFSIEKTCDFTRHAAVEVVLPFKSESAPLIAKLVFELPFSVDDDACVAGMQQLVRGNRGLVLGRRHKEALRLVVIRVQPFCLHELIKPMLRNDDGFFETT